MPCGFSARLRPPDVPTATLVRFTTTPSCCFCVTNSSVTLRLFSNVGSPPAGAGFSGRAEACGECFHALPPPTALEHGWTRCILLRLGGKSHTEARALLETVPPLRFPGGLALESAAVGLIGSETLFSFPTLQSWLGPCQRATPPVRAMARFEAVWVNSSLVVSEECCFKHI